MLSIKHTHTPNIIISNYNGSEDSWSKPGRLWEAFQLGPLIQKKGKLLLSDSVTLFWIRTISQCLPQNSAEFNGKAWGVTCSVWIKASLSSHLSQSNRKQQDPLCLFSHLHLGARFTDSGLGHHLCTFNPTYSGMRLSVESWLTHSFSLLEFNSTADLLPEDGSLKNLKQAWRVTAP